MTQTFDHFIQSRCLNGHLISTTNLDKKNVDQYKKEEMFMNGLGKFDDSWYILHSYDLSNYLMCTVSSDVVLKVLDEHKAGKSPNYISYVSGQASTPSNSRTNQS